MIEEYLTTFRVRHIFDEHRRDLDNFYLRMLRFFISHLMICNELSDAEKKTEFKKILNIEHEGLSLPDSYKNLELKNIIILFIYKHRMFRLAKMIYGC